MSIWIRPNRTEWMSFFVLMPVLTTVLNYLFFGNRIWTDYRVWVYSFPVIYVQGLGSWYLHIVVMHWLRVAFPDMKQIGLRLSILAVAHIGLTSLTFAMLFLGYDALNFLGYVLDISEFRMSVLLAIGLTMVATTLWEAEYLFKRWKDSIKEKEQVHQLSIQHEFETLKSQVNPHFLFNCFNTLSSLINEDRKQAETFLNELSKVYRYLLRNNEMGLSTVENEMKFINSYYQLLKTRHGEALHLNVEIDKKYEQYLLPSLSLQMLVENAVKHNVLSKNKPLVIDIFTTAGNRLVVNNNLQRRTVKGPSGKVGLGNIRAKYELLRQPGFQILEDGKNYSVVLPLVWSQSLEDQIHMVNGKAIIYSEPFKNLV